MLIGFSSRYYIRSRNGAALVIVLAFIVLLTGLIVAFFSRAISERQISNASVNVTKLDALTQGAVDTIIGDLKQEIAANSVPYDFNPVPPQGSKTLFVPRSLANMVPAPVLASKNGPTAGLENLVKQSVGGKEFFPTPAPSPTPVPDYPASNRAAGASGENSTTKPSLNGRYIAPDRWNKPLLIPAKSSTDLTPLSSAGFISPDWILVARDGSNGDSNKSAVGPTAWSSSLIASPNNTKAAVGRFAYNIYDEGGLLDANVAGFPAPAAGASASSATMAGLSGYYKNALAYADLTQLKDSAGNQLLNQSQIDALVGWRNSASADAPGAFPNPAFTDASRTSYYNYILTNPFGFLQVGNAALSATKQSDRMLPGRQTLISLMQTIAAQIPGNGAEKVQNSLQFLGTFSRDLNQPCYVPATFAATSPAPKVNAQLSGGNSAYDRSTNTDGTQIINPSFLMVRVKSAFVRNNGSTAIQDVEPLVKKRFALNRLAWLTYAGPLTLNGTSYNPKLDANYVSTLKTTYGFTDAFLLQGTPANIFKYFGLAWLTVADPTDNKTKPMWFYDHSSTTIPTTVSAAGLVKTLSGVAALSPGRDADFFELLKASVNVGSIAKSAYSGSSTGAQHNRDIQVDFAIIQLAANIIDQYDIDGYSTTIYFDDGAAAYGSYKSNQFHGIENLPYLYRLRANVIKASLPQKVAGGNSPYGIASFDNAAPNTISQTGIGCLMQLPELWNPHDWDATNTAQSNGIVSPTEFRIFSVGDSGAWFNAVQGGTAYTAGRSTTSATTDTASKDTGKSLPWFTAQFNGHTIKAPKLRTFSFDNTVMTFTNANNAFREPTVLYMAGKAGNLAAPGITGVTSGSTAPDASKAVVSELTGSGKTLILGTNGFKSAVPDPAVVGAAAGQEFVGFFVGAIPLRWVNSANPAQCFSAYYPRTDTGFSEMIYLQYKDNSGNWINYDEKYFENPFNNVSMGELMSGPSQMFFDVGAADHTPLLVNAVVVDPRTARFGSQLRDITTTHYGWNGDAPFQGSNGFSTKTASDVWVDGANGVVQTMRSDVSAGTSILNTNGNLYSPTAGWYPGNTAFNKTQLGKYSLRPGLLSQNSPTFTNDGKINSNGATVGPFSGSPGPQFQFYADPDGVVRRAMGAYVTGVSSTVGLPMTTANTVASGNATRNATQSPSRPMILNRPFRAVADLGYVFSGTPWRNLDFATPESGSSALLDVFCMNDTDDARGVVAGKVNLNTRQFPVLQAIISGAYKDEWKSSATTDGLTAANGSDPAQIAAALVARTSGATVNSLTPPSTTPQPLTNPADLIGRWIAAKDVTAPGPEGSNKTDGSTSYSGFVGDANLTTALGTTASVIERYREAPVRALANAGQTRMWNLMIDVIAQTGRYPVSATALDKFVVEGEQRYWVHVAIDRYTGEVIDKQVEVVKE